MNRWLRNVASICLSARLVLGLCGILFITLTNSSPNHFILNHSCLPSSLQRNALKLCVIIHHYQPLSKLSWAHQLLARCFHLFFFLLLETKSPFILSLLQTKIRSNWKPITLTGCSFICNYVNMLAHKGQSNSLTNLFQFLFRKISTSFFPSVWKRKSQY